MSTTPVTTRDGQYAYIRVEGQDGTWKKTRLSDKVVVGELKVPDRRTKHTPHTGYTGTSSNDDNDRYAKWAKEGFTVIKPTKTPPAKEAYWSRNYCSHEGKVKIFEVDGREFYGAGLGGIRPAEYALVLDLAGQMLPRTYWTRDAVILPSSKSWMTLNQHVAVGLTADVQGKDYVPPTMYKNVVYFNWPDMGIIRTNITFWEQLFDQMPKGKILVSCLGSHGRTGTCLAALMMASGWAESALEAVLAVRAYHCSHAIEHSNQLSFLNDLAAGWELPGNAGKAGKVQMGKELEALNALRAVDADIAAKKG